MSSNMNVQRQSMYCRQPSMANTVQTTNKTFKHTVPELCDPDPITCVIQPGEDGGCGLYIGNLESAKNAKILQQYQIKAVLTASIETGLQYNEELVPFHMKLPAHDQSDYDITQHLNQSLNFILTHFYQRPVLVHCFMGISRSASIVIAFLMQTKLINFEQALFFLKSKRRQVQPNPGFVLQLLKFEKTLKLQNQNYQNVQIQNENIAIKNEKNDYNQVQNNQQPIQFQLDKNQQFYLNNIVQVPHQDNTLQQQQIYQLNQESKILMEINRNLKEPQTLGQYQVVQSVLKKKDGTIPSNY